MLYITMKLFDSHCHLYMPQFDADREEVLSRMQEGGVGAVVVGADLETSRKAIELAQSRDFLWASVGLHPSDNPNEEFDPEAYEELARDPKVVALGECGLEYFRSSDPDQEREAQLRKFEAQIVLAQKVNKALIIHCRNPRQKVADTKSAHDDTLALLAKHKLAVPVIIHFFTGSGELAQKYLELGCYLSFPGPITYTDMYDDSIRVCPLDRMLIETDAPYAAPVPHRGKRNEPNFVVAVAEKIAQIKGIPTQEIVSQTVANVRTVFGI
jgi:TatD DNase family protein